MCAAAAAAALLAINGGCLHALLTAPLFASPLRISYCPLLRRESGNFLHQGWQTLRPSHKSKTLFVKSYSFIWTRKSRMSLTRWDLNTVARWYCVPYTLLVQVTCSVVCSIMCYWDPVAAIGEKVPFITGKRTLGGVRRWEIGDSATLDMPNKGTEGWCGLVTKATGATPLPTYALPTHVGHCHRSWRTDYSVDNRRSTERCGAGVGQSCWPYTARSAQEGKVKEWVSTITTNWWKWNANCYLCEVPK